ncbi:long-chain fatty acid--CoA ligase [Thiohalobacter sp. IOR34]|uniref:AMP-dependent synthetase/ligase n=1 Tax=Thiohalobacter sp. IOR34 TaxID=3057176 RepID=UPI0025AF30A3|nr:long-chain fatty acid--CoA ligase [Thiohalobacter sp. IOR34]WJW74263.1 long-chain fatty acid--CoA ligase [Thiohalobacter sp. IOR34]
MKPDVISPEVAGTLPGLFRERVRRSPQALAYRQYDPAGGRWRDYNWARMAADVIRCQAALEQEGLVPGERVAILLRNCREWVMFEQAALGLGLVVVPLYADDRAENLAYILQNAGVKLLLLGGEPHWQALRPVHDRLGFLQRILSLGPLDSWTDARLMLLDDWLPAAAEGELRLPPGGPEALATIVYTSGTTGRPKGVMLSHHNILWNAHASQRQAPVGADDLFLSFLPLSHTFERTVGYYLPMMCGAGIVYNRSVPELAEDLRTQRPTLLVSVPRIFERVHGRIHAGLEKKSPLARRLFAATVAVGWQRFERAQGRASWSPALLSWPLFDRLVARKVMDRLGGRLRLAVCGGAALSPEVARLFIGLGLPLLQGYGLTETSPVVSGNSLEDNLPASVGKPLQGVEVLIGDKDELLVRSPGVMLGYWQDPQATAEVIDADGWLHTGDQARIDAEGHIFITGRLKEIIVLSTGEKIPPADMEMAIGLDPLFEQVMVVGDGRPYLSALLVLNPQQLTEEAQRLGLDVNAPTLLKDDYFTRLMLERVAGHIQQFPGYAQIRRVTCYLEPWDIEDGLITPTLKLRRSRIEARLAEDIEAMYAGH